MDVTQRTRCAIERQLALWRMRGGAAPRAPRHPEGTRGEPPPRPPANDV